MSEENLSWRVLGVAKLYDVPDYTFYILSCPKCNWITHVKVRTSLKSVQCSECKKVFSLDLTEMKGGSI